VAQIYGVGIITTRFTGVQLEIGVFLGLAGILVCSFLGGMRAVTWTQVAQYIILIVAYMIPVVMLAYRNTGVPIPHVVYGYTLQKVTEREKQLTTDAKEVEVREIFKKRAADASARVKALPDSYNQEKAKVEKSLADLRASNAPAEKLKAAEDAVKGFPVSADEARARWSAEAGANAARAAPPRPHATEFPGATEKARDIARKNFLALIFCLMIGTAALPHILMRYYTTPSVREARVSVTWSLFFIFLLYFTAPALAVLVKYEMYHFVVGTAFADLPAWVKSWSAVDRTLLNIQDINGDGIVQLAEIVIGGDIVVLATPEIAKLPYVVSGLVAAGGLAAALSTADGLLLTIANALSHDLYYKIINPAASTKTRLTVAKMLLLVVAILAASVASQKPADILFLVSAAFSLAAASFFPALTLGIFWKRANKWGATLGMIAGTGITFYYMCITQPWLRSVFGVKGTIAENTWWDINPISAGTFGVPLGFAVIIIVSLLTPAPDRETQELVDHVRYPVLEGDMDTRGT
jgi:cation/acetate symporter